jgi:hypothetical protein
MQRIMLAQPNFDPENTLNGEELYAQIWMSNVTSMRNLVQPINRQESCSASAQFEKLIFWIHQASI